MIDNNVYIVLAKEEDAKTLAEVKQKAWATTYRGIYPDEKIDYFDYKLHTERFISFINNKEQYLFKVLKDNKIIGYFCVGKPRVEYKDFTFALNMLYLLNEYRHQGIGTLIMNYIKELAKNVADKFLVNCSLYNQNAINFYLKNGGTIIFCDGNHEKKEEDILYIEIYCKE